MSFEMVSCWTSVISCIAVVVQIFVIVRIANQWKKQKRREQYSKNCYHILINHWQRFEHYWYVLMGTAVYRPNVKEHYERVIEDSEDSIIYLESFLRDPEIFISKDDKESIDTIKEIRRVYFIIENIFKRYLELDDFEELNYSVCLRKGYYKSAKDICLDESNIEKIDKIENDTNCTDLEKEIEVGEICKSELKNHVDQIKNILLDYTHFVLPSKCERGKV